MILFISESINKQFDQALRLSHQNFVFVIPYLASHTQSYSPCLFSMIIHHAGKCIRFSKITSSTMLLLGFLILISLIITALMSSDSDEFFLEILQNFLWAFVISPFPAFLQAPSGTGRCSVISPEPSLLQA